MRRRNLAALGGAALAAVAVAVPTVASASGADAPAAASAQDAATDGNQRCEQEFLAAIKEDNDAYEARDIERYEAILNPRMIFNNAGVITNGRDPVIQTARASFAVPGWHWQAEVLSYTLHGCNSGIAVVDARTTWPDNPARDAHYSVTMVMVREHGKWTVAMDTVDPVKE